MGLVCLLTLLSHLKLIIGLVLDIRLVVKFFTVVMGVSRGSFALEGYFAYFTKSKFITMNCFFSTFFYFHPN